MKLRKRAWILRVKDVRNIFGSDPEPRILTFTANDMNKLKDEWLDTEMPERVIDAEDLTSAIRASWHAMDEYGDYLTYDSGFGGRVIVCDLPEYDQVLSATTLYDDPRAETIDFIGR